MPYDNSMSSMGALFSCATLAILGGEVAELGAAICRRRQAAAKPTHDYLCGADAAKCPAAEQVRARATAAALTRAVYCTPSFDVVGERRKIDTAARRHGVSQEKSPISLFIYADAFVPTPALLVTPCRRSAGDAEAGAFDYGFATPAISMLAAARWPLAPPHRRRTRACRDFNAFITTPPSQC